MKVIATYDSKRDLEQVDQVGYIDLSECFLEGAVPAGADIEQNNFNDIDDPASIAGRPSDVFEAMQAARSLQNVVHERSNSES